MDGPAQTRSPPTPGRSRTGSTNVSPMSIANKIKQDSASKRNKQNLVLSTSFNSTRKIDNTSPSPTSPLEDRRTANNVNKMLMSVKAEVLRLEQELAVAKRKRENTEKLRDTTETNIYSGTYSTEHLQKHSMRIRTNTQIREYDKTIKKLEKEIQELTKQFEAAKTAAGNDKLIGNESVSIGYLENLSKNRGTRSADHTMSSFQNSTDHSTDADASANSTVLTFDTLSRSRSHTPINATIESGTWKISECMQNLKDTHASSDFILQQSNRLVELLLQFPELRDGLILTSFLQAIQDLLLRDDKVISASAYRICRYLINGEASIKELIKLRLDVFIIMSLTKDNDNIMEREQAIKLIRAFSEHRTGVTKGVVQALISCIEKSDDNIRNIALETLLELCFQLPQVVSECGGTRVLEGLLQDYSSFSLASLILDTVLDLMATHSTRKYFLNDFNICVLATVFSDFNGKDSISTERLQNSAVLISRALRNDNGLMLFCMDNFKPIKELLAFIEVPICSQYLIDIFLDVLHIKYHHPTQGRNSIDNRKPSEFLHESSTYNQRLILLISILEQCKFTSLLSKFIDTGNTNDFKGKLVDKTRYLLAEYINMRNNLIRERDCTSYKSASTDQWKVYQDSFKFDKMIQEMNKGRNTLGVQEIDYNDKLREYSKKVKDNIISGDIDDLIFRKMIYDTKVLQTKDFTLWNWNIIQELLEGPLMNPKQLDELVRSTKFIRRLLVFYRPLRLRFSDVNQGSKLSQKFVQVGCSFFKMLTSNSEGMKILTDDTKIIPQLASLVFKAIEEGSNRNIFNENSLRTKIIPGYFKFIGVLTESKNGISVLMRWNFFTVIYKMFQFDSRIGLKCLLYTLPELDLRFSSHCRNILGRALVVSNENVRMRATRLLGYHLKQTLHNSVGDSRSTDENLKMQRYLMEMLTRQLYDLSPYVVALADQALYEFIAEGDKSLELETSLRTILNQMVFISSPILFELLSRPYGFHLLNEINFIEIERASWLKTKNREYVDTIELFLKNNVYFKKNEQTDYHMDNGGNKLPLHLYQSLAKTEDGITLLSQSGDLVKFMNTIKKYVSEGMRNENPDDVLNIKAAIWCCGFIGSTELGIGLLDNYSLVEDILQISYNTSITKVRFTAFYALGLISSTREGCEILDEMGWNCTLDVQYDPLGITLPDRLDKFLSYPEKEWIIQKTYQNELVTFNKINGKIIGDVVPVKFDLDHLLSEKNIIESTIPAEKSADDSILAIERHAKSSEELVHSASRNSLRERSRASTISSVLYANVDSNIVDTIMDSISKLGNHILSNAAIKTITDINNKHGPALFESETMFLKVLDMLEKFRFKPQVRKFLCELFINPRALDGIIRHDRKLHAKSTSHQPALEGTLSGGNENGNHDHGHGLDNIPSSISMPSSPLS